VLDVGRVKRGFIMKFKKGTTLIEVTAALLIAAMTTVAIFSVVLSTSVSNKKADRKEVAAMAIKMAQERLKAYVTSDISNSFLINRPGDMGGWHLPGDSNTGWALAQGNHNITSWLSNPNFAELQGGSFTYNVVNRNCLGFPLRWQINDFNTCKTVTFTLNFPD